MSDSTDAYVAVTIQFADGRSLTGKPPLYADGRALVLELEEWARTERMATLDDVVAKFCASTGITEADLKERRTLMDVIDVMQRFFYHRQPATSPPKAPAPAGASS